jgi:hypothetical protein
MTAGQFSDEAVGSQQSQLAAEAGRGAKSEAAAARKSHDEDRAVRLEEIRCHLGNQQPYLVPATRRQA